MRTRLLAYATFTLVALGVTTVFVLRHSRPAATPQPPPERPGAVEADAVTVTRVFGAVSVQRPDAAPYWLGAEDDVGRSATLEAADRPALLAFGANEILLRAGSRLRLWREGDATVARLDQGEIFVDAGPAAMDVRCPFSVMLRAAAGSVLVSPQGAQIAVSRGTVLCRTSAQAVELVEGDVAEASESRLRIWGALEASDSVAWAGEILATRNLHRNGAIAVRPETRYRLRGAAAHGRLAVRAGRETLGGWTLPAGRFAVDFATAAGTREITIEGTIADALLLELGGD